VFVPSILWAFAVLFARTGDITGMKPFEHIHPLLETNLAFFSLLIYGAYYLMLDLVGGATILVELFLFWVSATHVAKHNENWLMIFIVVQVVSWAMQIGAHKVFEGRSPALLDNLAQAFLMAPFFVWLEILFFFGYKPQLHKDLDGIIGKEVLAYRQSLKNKAK
jgi:2-hydroxy fatty acid dioxygenase